MPRKTTAGVVVAAALLLAACGGDGSVEIGPGDDRTEATIASDEVLEVRLRGNPTTGFTWEVAEEGVLRLIDRSHEPDTDLDGSPGVTTLRFEPTRVGTADLVLVYHRSWEEGVPPEETRTITVTVEP